MQAFSVLAGARTEVQGWRRRLRRNLRIMHAELCKAAWLLRSDIKGTVNR